MGCARLCRAARSDAEALRQRVGTLVLENRELRARLGEPTDGQCWGLVLRCTVPACLSTLMQPPETCPGCAVCPAVIHGLVWAEISPNAITTVHSPTPAACLSSFELHKPGSDSQDIVRLAFTAGDADEAPLEGDEAAQAQDAEAEDGGGPLKGRDLLRALSEAAPPSNDPAAGRSEPQSQTASRPENGRGLMPTVAAASAVQI